MIITQEYKSVNVKYRGHKITVKRWADLASGETLHWKAVVDGNDEWTVVGETCIELAGKIKRLLGEIEENENA